MLIFLVGYMACGKSTIGRKLSKRLRLPLYDTDKEIVNREGITVAEIFDSRGEEEFRYLEASIIKELITNNILAIISTGGGAPTWGDNMARMNDAGVVVYLRRSAENICSRISAFGREKRPKLRGLNDSELLEVMQKGVAERDACYSQANLIIEADGCSDDEILEMIVAHVEEMNVQNG
ncbi:MAG: shikimate kinase [Rikenellaceae bacterium]